MIKKTSKRFGRTLAIGVVFATLAGGAFGQVAGPRSVRLDNDSEMRPSVVPWRVSRPGPAFVQPGRAETTPTHLIIESGPVSFGEVPTDREKAVEDAVMVRVFSDSEWELRLVPEAALAFDGGPEKASMSRLEWRSVGSAQWKGFRSGEPVVVGRGRPTGPSGELVSVDLRLRLNDRDPIGQYGFNLRLLLEAEH